MIQHTTSEKTTHILGEKILVKSNFHGTKTPRYYRMVKPNMSALEKYPALISIHAQGSSDYFQANFDGFWKSMPNYGIAIVYPQGTCNSKKDFSSCASRAWNAGNCCGKAKD
jgi:poly(3-hydroxybutyrate) depolymerase